MAWRFLRPYFLQTCSRRHNGRRPVRASAAGRVLHHNNLQPPQSRGSVVLSPLFPPAAPPGPFLPMMICCGVSRSRGARAREQRSGALPHGSACACAPLPLTIPAPPFLLPPPPPAHCRASAPLPIICARCSRRPWESHRRGTRCRHSLDTCGHVCSTGQPRQRAATRTFGCHFRSVSPRRRSLADRSGSDGPVDRPVSRSPSLISSLTAVVLRF